MAEEKIPIHYVCTHKEAKDLIKQNKKFWVSNCGCREGRDNKCVRSRIDVCLMFVASDEGSGSGKKSITRDEADEIMKEAEVKFLVARPFRNEKRTKTDGICFCCDDCCGYFLTPDKYTSDKGQFIEKTDLSRCTDCGLCEEVCYFKARPMKDGKLVIDHHNCYGCGLCVKSCPEECIKMAKRK